MVSGADHAPSRRLLLVVFVVAAAWAGVAAPSHATYGARLTADEPQYVLSAISLAEDGDLTALVGDSNAE